MTDRVPVAPVEEWLADHGDRLASLGPIVHTPLPGLHMTVDLKVVRSSARGICPQCGHKRNLFNLSASVRESLAGSSERLCAPCAGLR